MTEVELGQIEHELHLTLPQFYRDYQLHDADEATRLDAELREKYDAGWETLPLTTPDEVVKLNQYLRREVAAGDRKWWVVGEDRRPWPVEGRFLIGDSGAGGYCFIHTDGTDENVWWWDHETVELKRSDYTLADILPRLRAILEQERQWAAEEEGK